MRIFGFKRIQLLAVVLDLRLTYIFNIFKYNGLDIWEFEKE
jgi:hypothetical protein